MKINKLCDIWISEGLLYCQMDKFIWIVNQYAAKYDILEKHYSSVLK